MARATVLILLCLLMVQDVSCNGYVEQQEIESGSEELTRILVGIYRESYPLRSVDIQTREVTPYSSEDMRYVTALAYIAGQRKLLVATWEPNKIESSVLDSDQLDPFVDNVQAWGMAVDESKDYIFMTTRRPTRSISRVTTSGSDLTAIADLTPYSEYSASVTLDPEEMVVYACVKSKLLAVNYNGTDLREVARGSQIFAVAFSSLTNTLYYNSGSRIKAISSTGTADIAVDIARIGIQPWNFALYQNTIYFSSGPFSYSKLGAVDLSGNPANVSVLKTGLSSKRATSIVLVP